MSDSDKYYVDDSYHSLKRKLETLGISEWQHMDVRSKSILVVSAFIHPQKVMLTPNLIRLPYGAQTTTFPSLICEEMA